MTTKIHRFNLATLLLVAANSSFSQGSVGYQVQGGGDDYTHHSLSLNTFATRWWGGLVAGSGYAGGSEVDQQWSLDLGATLGDQFELSGTGGQSKDSALSVDEYTLAGHWTTPWQWAERAPMRLGVQWGYADYGLRNTALAASGRLPDQFHAGLSLSLPVSDAMSFSLASQWNRYTVDPVAMATQLLQRKRARISAAMTLADFGAFDHRLGMDWRTSNRWRWSLGAAYGQTVLGQTQRSIDAGLEIPWNAASSVGLSIQHAQSDEVLRANGQPALAYQTSNTLSLRWNWNWD